MMKRFSLVPENFTLDRALTATAPSLDHLRAATEVARLREAFSFAVFEYEGDALRFRCYIKRTPRPRSRNPEQR